MTSQERTAVFQQFPAAKKWWIAAFILEGLLLFGLVMTILNPFSLAFIASYFVAFIKAIPELTTRAGWITFFFNFVAAFFVVATVFLHLRVVASFLLLDRLAVLWLWLLFAVVIFSTFFLNYNLGFWEGVWTLLFNNGPVIVFLILEIIFFRKVLRLISNNAATTKIPPV